MTSLRARLGGGLGAPFWRLLTASAMANAGDGVFWVALPLLAVGITTEPALVAGVTVASRLPWLLFALVAGVAADRTDRRRLMVALDAVRAAAILGLGAAVVAGTASMPLLYAVAFVLGVCETFHDTAAQTLVPAVVARERLEPANGRLMGVELLANQFVGPPLGGLLAAIALSLAFGTAAAGYLGAGLLLATVPGAFRAATPAAATSIRTELAEGVRYLAHHRLLRTMALVVGGLNLFGGAVWGVLVLYVVAPGPLGLDEVGFGLLLTVVAVGSIVGTLGASVVERLLGRANLLAATIAGIAVQHLTLALTDSAVVVALVLGTGGLVLGAFNPVFVSFRQRVVPDRLLGRVVGTFRLLGLGTLPLGALMGGVLAQAFGLPAVFWFAALATLALLPARLLVTDARLAAAEAEAGARPEGATG